MDCREVIARHEVSGRLFTAAGVDSFVLDAGSGEPVVCLHGVPASAFLYRKLVPKLAERRLRGIAFDLPGLGSPSGRRTSTTPGPASAGSPSPR